jgi:hypothetical protein
MTRRRLLTEIGWRIEARGSSVLVYKANQRTDASGMEDYLRTAARVAAVLAGR